MRHRKRKKILKAAVRRYAHQAATAATQAEREPFDAMDASQ